MHATIRTDYKIQSTRSEPSGTGRRTTEPSGTSCRKPRTLLVNYNQQTKLNPCKTTRMKYLVVCMIRLDNTLDAAMESINGTRKFTCHAPHTR